MIKTRRKYILIFVALLVVWNVFSWLVARSFYHSRVDEIIAQKTKLSRDRAGDLADSITRNLSYLDGIPDLLSQLLRVKNATMRFGEGAKPSALPLKERKKRWTNDPVLNNLSQYLELAKVSLNADIIFVINAGGDCIAASNWNTKGTTIGTNFVDREYYRENKAGRRGRQYAVGKTTNIPGLYFSTPVMIDGHFLGAVVAKIDVPNLSFMVHEINAFVIDKNGVIVLARDKKLEMHAMPGALINRQTEQMQVARYKRSSFPAFQIGGWGDGQFPALMRFQDEHNPYVYSVRDIPLYDMKAYVVDRVDEYHSLDVDKLWFAFLLGMSGSVLILMAGGLILYLTSLKAKGIALERANRAEQRIISISEETQQRIGGELHDDLGQLLTGVAFMSEVLSQKLSNKGYAEAAEASKITDFINEAIDKTRRLAQGLYPVELKAAGLPAMLDNLALNTEWIYHINCEFVSVYDQSIEDPLTVIHLFRIAQEAVNNAVKHGNPAKITLRLSSTPHAITLEISDDGSGIALPAGPDSGAGMGLRSMQYRASLLGGTLHLAALPQGGTRLVVNLPA